MAEVTRDEGKRTARRQEHVISMYCIIVCNHRGEKIMGPIVHTAPSGVGEHFITTVMQLEEQLFRMRKEYPLHWSAAQRAQHEAATHCELCGNPFSSPEGKVSDHLWYEQYNNYRAALCGNQSQRKCNLLRRPRAQLVAMCYNSMNFDNHLVMLSAVKHPALRNKRITLLPKTKTK